MEASAPRRVAIAGAGPRGLYCLERLAAHARVSGMSLRVDVFEPGGEPGAGAVYSSDQPDWLRMNFADAMIDAWPSTGVESAVPSHRRESFLEWRRGREPGAGEELADGYSSRALVGRYLADCFAAVVASLPPAVEVRVHRARVETAERGEGGRGWRLGISGGRSAAVECDELLLATGHRQPTAARSWRLGPRGVRAGYPLGESLSTETVAPGQPVIVRGMALTLIDVALALTEGRGGSFVPIEDAPGRLMYVPAPDEAGTITALSRSGRPMLVKPGASLPVQGSGAEQVLAEGRRRLVEAERFDPDDDIVPAVGAVAAALHSDAAGGGDRQKLMPTAPTLACWLAELLDREDERSAVASAPRRIARSLRIAAGARAPDVRWALGEAWRGLYPAIVDRGSHGGIDPAAWPRFSALAREMERIAFGPPPVNGAKLLALIEAGKVELGSMSDLRDAPGQAVRVDAVLGAPGAGERCGDIIDRLRETGAIRVAPGGRRGIEVDREGSCIGGDGARTPGLAAVGRLTEDWVIGNDTLNRGLHEHPGRWARRVAAA